MNRLTIEATDPIERARRAAAVDDAQAVLLAGALGDCPCAGCALEAWDPTRPDALGLALLRYHAWSTSVGPMQ